MMPYPIGTTFTISIPENIEGHDIVIDDDFLWINKWRINKRILNDKFIYLGGSEESRSVKGLPENIKIIKLFILDTEADSRYYGSVLVPEKLLVVGERITDYRKMATKGLMNAVSVLTPKDPGSLIAYKSRANVRGTSYIKFIESIRKNVPSLKFIDGIEAYIEALLHVDLAHSILPDINIRNGEVFSNVSPVFCCYLCEYHISIREVAKLVGQETNLILHKGQNPVFRFKCPACGTEYMISYAPGNKYPSIITAEGTEIGRIQNIDVFDEMDYPDDDEDDDIDF